MILAQSINFKLILSAMGLGGDFLSIVLGFFLYVVLIADIVMLVIPKPSNSLFSIMVVIGLLTALLSKLSLNGGSALVGSGGVGGSAIHDLLTPKTLPHFLMGVVMVMAEITAAGTVNKPNARTWGIIASIAGMLVVLGGFAQA